MNWVDIGSTKLLSNSLIEYYFEKSGDFLFCIKDEEASLELSSRTNKFYGNINPKSDVEEQIVLEFVNDDAIEGKSGSMNSVLIRISTDWRPVMSLHESSSNIV